MRIPPSLIGLTAAVAVGFVATTAGAASHRKAVFIGQYDSSDDGRLTFDEFEKARRARFDWTDENEDGIVDADEYAYEWEDRIDEQFERDRRNHMEAAAARFGALDRDGNGRMTREEYAASGERIFTGHDADGNGVLDERDARPDEPSDTDRQIEIDPAWSADERERQFQQIVANVERQLLRMPTTHTRSGTIAMFDTDGDGVVTAAEFEAGRVARFDATDTDGNGWLSREEYTYEFEDRVDAEIERTRKAQIDQAYVRFDALDRDDDGRMTFEEYQISGKRAFTRWDTDEDGVVTLGEADPPPTESEVQREGRRSAAAARSGR